jgi:GT2 family glycosyltransferase
MEQPLVYNIILNTNRRVDTLACLASLAKSTYSNQRTIVLDNASTDGSKQAIEELYPHVQIISLSDNRGYAGNNNVGIDAALKHGAEWIFVLNEDITLAPECLTELIKVGESHPEIGITGPLVYHNDEPEIIQSAGGIIDRFWRSMHAGQNEVDRNQYPEPRRVDWISGCAILVRREVVEQVGALDARFFYYWEEVEWCIRAREKGWQIWHVPQAKIWHKGVQRNYNPGPNVTYYATRNRLIAMRKHHAPVSVWAFTILDITKTLISWRFRPSRKKMTEHRKAMWQGTVDFFRHSYGIRSV